MPPSDYVGLFVTDTGTGMAPDVVVRTFDPFYTTKPISQGTGLGLSMIHGFVEQSGGHVLLRSEVGQGTTVAIYLPRHLGVARNEEKAKTAAEIVPTDANIVVLVMDDEAIVRMVVVEVLEDSFYRVLEAENGIAAMAIVDSGVRIDLLLTDVGLPGGMNGRQLADAARQKRPGLKILFITGYAESAAVGNGHMEAGMQVMTKPFKVDALIARVQGILGN